MRQLIHQIWESWFAGKTNRKLLIFESDDWGAIYLPCNSSIRNLEKAGILTTDRTNYTKYDCLENRTDLESLFDLLSQFRDMNGNPAKFTFNTVMGNPDFEKIQESDFENYYHQHFFHSYQQYNNEDCRDLWASGINNRLFTPQFHAYEHLNVPRWMRDLQANRQDTRIAFQNHYYCQRRSATSPVDYLTAYWPGTIEDLAVIEKHIQSGLAEFESTFKFPSKTFIACCYVLPREVEKMTADNGVRLIQTQRRHRVPLVHKQKSTFRSRYTGQKNHFGQVYSVRTVQFEPSTDHSLDWAELAFQQTTRAFKKGLPAVVSSHRVNYVGGRDLNNRQSSLRQLEKFLKLVTENYSDIEFLSSDELLPIINQSIGTTVT